MLLVLVKKNINKMDDKYVFIFGKKLLIIELLFFGFVDIRRCNII